MLIRIILVLADNDKRVTEHLSFSNIEFRRLAKLYALLVSTLLH